MQNHANEKHNKIKNYLVNQYQARNSTKATVINISLKMYPVEWEIEQMHYTMIIIIFVSIIFYSKLTEAKWHIYATAS